MASKHRDTAPAVPFGPTAIYGDCEARGCEVSARVTCPDCAGHYCRDHAEHETHTA
jgi:hypothetical protein